MDREEAAKLVDRMLDLKDRSHADGRCGSCEAVIHEREVPVDEVPDSILAAYAGSPPDAWVISDVQHGPDCPVTAFEAIASDLEREFGFEVVFVPRFKEMPNGDVRSWTRLIRVPAPGDPPPPD